jgi:hypothetical protein
MNFTFPAPPLGPVFTEGQKIFYSFSSVPCLIFAYVIWRVAKKRLRRDEHYVKRIQALYNLMTACLFGVFVCISIPHATTRAELGGNPAYSVYAVAAFGILTGFIGMLILQDCGRVLHTNPYYTSPAVVHEPQEALLNEETMETNDHVNVSNLNDFSSQYLAGIDKYKDQTKRFVLFFILFVVIVYMTVVDGFFLIYWSDKTVDPTGHWVMLAMGWIVRIAYSTIVYGALVHGMIHAIPMDRWYRHLYSYGAFVFYYFLALVGGTIPMLLNMGVVEATYIIQRIPFTLFYGISSGVTLWFLTYYAWIQDETLTRGDVRKRTALIVCVALVLGITGLFI